MIYVQDILKIIEPALDSGGKPEPQEFAHVCQIMASGDFMYAYPYQMKVLAIKFAKYVALFMEMSLIK